MIDKQEVLERLDMREYFAQFFPQARNGHTEITVCSPFREEKHPSFSFNAESGLWCDHGTGDAGDVFAFEQRMSRCDFTTAVENVARKAGITGTLHVNAERPSMRKVQTHGTKADAVRWSAALFERSGTAARAFLNKRGLTDETLKQYLIGYDDKLHAVTVPLSFQNEEIISLKRMYFEGHGWRMRNGKKDFKLHGSGVLYCAELIQNVEDVLVCEGELDCLLLRQNGFDAVTGSNGAGTWKDEWTTLLRDKTVTVVYDSDESGRKGALKVARALRGTAREVRVIDLFPENDGKDKTRKDVTDFFIKDRRTAEELRTLVRNAAPLQPEGKPNVLSLLEDPREEVEVCPAQDYVNGTFNYAMRIHGKPYLVTSNKECFSFEECADRNLRLSSGQVDKFRFSPTGIRSFLSGGIELDPHTLYARIAGYIKRYIVFKDPDCFSFLSLWIMGTYIFRAFRYYPYVHLIGEKQSGKTLLMDILAPIAFNGELSTNATEAVLFRDVQNNQLTLFLDEVERFRGEDRERYGAVMDVLKTGFSKSGLVKRCGGKDKDKIHSFRTYSPKMLAGINEIDDVLRDRTIRIQMVRRLASEPAERYRENKETEDTHREIRDHLYTFGLTNGPEIADIYQNNLDDIDGVEHLSNREYDIWAPIILLANCVDVAGGNGSVTETAIRFSTKKISEHRKDDSSDNTTSKLLVALNAMVQEVTPVKEDGNTLTFDTESAFQFFKSQDEFSWLEGKTWLTRHLRSVEVSKGNQKIAGKTARVYIIDKLKLKDFTERYVGREGTSPLGESVTVTEPVTSSETKG